MDHLKTKCFHSFRHKAGEICECFSFLDSCTLTDCRSFSMTSPSGKIVDIYDTPQMHYYPFHVYLSNKDRFIPMGRSISLSVVEKDKIYRLVSSRTYGGDSLIYFDKQLHPLVHRYSHKYPFRLSKKIAELEKSIVESYPYPPPPVVADNRNYPILTEYSDWEL